MYLDQELMVVRGTPRDAMDLGVPELVTAKTDAHGRDVLSQSLHKNAYVRQTARGNWV